MRVKLKLLHLSYSVKTNIPYSHLSCVVFCTNISGFLLFFSPEIKLKILKYFFLSEIKNFQILMWLSFDIKLTAECIFYKLRLLWI